MHSEKHTARASQMISNRFRDILTAGPGILVCFVGASVLFWEWFRIWAVADPQEVAGYFFGSESMVAHGGWKYRSAAVYAWSSFAEGTLGLLPIVMFIRAVQQGSRKKAILAYVVMAMIYLTISLR